MFHQGLVKLRFKRRLLRLENREKFNLYRPSYFQEGVNVPNVLKGITCAKYNLKQNNGRDPAAID